MEPEFKDLSAAAAVWMAICGQPLSEAIGVLVQKDMLFAEVLEVKNGFVC